MMKKTNKKIREILYSFIVLALIIVSLVLIIKLNNYTKLNYSNKDVKNILAEKDIEFILTEDNEIKNVIFMLGDGMGEKHIKAAEMYKGETLNMQKIQNKCYITTNSLQGITDSAAAATAYATGYKTYNNIVGKDKDKKDVENIIEYANKRGLKTGIVCTQKINHATPAGFSVHHKYRKDYDIIANLQIESCVDLMFGGGRKYFKKYEDKMNENEFVWINDFSKLDNVTKDSRVIGTFADDTISKEKDRVSLSDMSSEAFNRLENDNGFFLLIEGSDIDSYSHKADMDKMLDEMIDFDDAVLIAKEYVDNHPGTLLIVTADHECGGLDLTGITSAEELDDSLFTSGGEHTGVNVLLFAYGIGAEELTESEVIDNTAVNKFLKQAIKRGIE